MEKRTSYLWSSNYYGKLNNAKERLVSVSSYTWLIYFCPNPTKNYKYVYDVKSSSTQVIQVSLRSILRLINLFRLQLCSKQPRVLLSWRKAKKNHFPIWSNLTLKTFFFFFLLFLLVKTCKILTRKTVLQLQEMG